MLHTGKSADYVNLALKNGAVSLVINLGSGAFEALVEPVNGKFNDNAWHDVKVTRNLRQVTRQTGGGGASGRASGRCNKTRMLIGLEDEAKGRRVDENTTSCRLRNAWNLVWISVGE